MVERSWRMSVEDRALRGREVRRRVPRSVHGEWAPSPVRPEATSLLARQEAGRVPELVPLRHERMASSPFAFFRGAANVLASDLADEPRTGLVVQLCGDAHLANFGAFASPERSLVFDINDFDETLPGPFEWDVKRLVASFEVAARSNGFDASQRASVVETCSRAYSTSMAEFSQMGHLELWYSRLTVDDIFDRWRGTASPAAMKRFQSNVRKAKGKNNLKALGRLTEIVEGEPRFVSDPPLLSPVRELFASHGEREIEDLIGRALKSYQLTLLPERRLLLGRYQMVDLARKVVGVGSVGTRCWVGLLVGRDAGDPLFLQVKEAEESVLEPYLGASEFPQHGQRVVDGQRLTQSASDIFLGWVRLAGSDGRDHDYYFRQLWDWKASADIESMEPETLEVYAQVCGITLARAHARTGDSVAIAAYLGRGHTFASAMVRFAASYADQNEVDHAAMVASMDREPPPESGDVGLLTS